MSVLINDFIINENIMNELLAPIEPIEPILHFEHIYQINNIVKETLNKNIKTNKDILYPNRETMNRDSNSDLETVDGINDSLIQTKHTYCTSFDCSFNFVFCCFAICLEP